MFGGLRGTSQVYGVSDVAQVEFVDLEKTVRASGMLLPLRKVEVGAQVTGQLQAVLVRLGQHVARGDLLAIIDPTLAKSELLGQEAALEQQSAVLESRKIDLAFAERELARQKSMLAEEATTTSDVERADSLVQKLHSEIRGFLAALRQTRAQVDASRAKLAYTRITAPIEGEVVNILVQEGQTVNSVQQAPTILSIAQMKFMTVRARIPEADVRKVREGQVAYFTTLGDESRRHYGKVRTIQPAPERIRDALFYNALFDVPNPNNELKLEMTVQVAFVLEKQEHVLSIPIAALGKQNANGSYLVTVVSVDGIATAREVTTGIDDQLRIEVKAGLSEGERVLITSSREREG